VKFVELKEQVKKMKLMKKKLFETLKRKVEVMNQSTIRDVKTGQFEENKKIVDVAVNSILFRSSEVVIQSFVIVNLMELKSI
jgi:hypothetical protein